MTLWNKKFAPADPGGSIFYHVLISITQQKRKNWNLTV